MMYRTDASLRELNRGAELSVSLSLKEAGMAETTILQSFVAMQERKLQAKVDAIAQGGQMAVNHQVGGKGIIAISQSGYF